MDVVHAYGATAPRAVTQIDSMDWSMRILVTGGNRYIGLSLVRELAQRRHEVTVVNSHLVDLPAGVERLHADRRSPEKYREILQPLVGNIDAVYDNTAYRPDELELLLSLLGDSVQHYLFTSSVAVYRRKRIQPIYEDDAVHTVNRGKPLQSYALDKVSCEQLLRTYEKETGVPTTTFRVGHTFGPRSPLSDRDPAIFARIEQGRPVVLPGDGLALVHLVHIDDVARMMADALLVPRAFGQAFNIAGREYASIIELVKMFADAMSLEPNIVCIPLDVVRRSGIYPLHWREGLAGSAIFSTRKCFEHLHSEAQLGLVEGLRDSYRWYESGGRDTYQFDFSSDDALLGLASRE